MSPEVVAKFDGTCAWFDFPCSKNSCDDLKNVAVESVLVVCCRFLTFGTQVCTQ